MSGQGESALLENLQKSREKDKFCSTSVSENRKYHQVTLLSKKPINDMTILVLTIRGRELWPTSSSLMQGLSKRAKYSINKKSSRT